MNENEREAHCNWIPSIEEQIFQRFHSDQGYENCQEKSTQRMLFMLARLPNLPEP